ncbi:hypothetical protein FS749_010258 [Ceratobasidium sp. UAMH 11750]|nr:hypothetical protein FS749_010258 [Ceratobasidium sp. UAMH 11750]
MLRGRRRMVLVRLLMVRLVLLLALLATLLGILLVLVVLGHSIRLVLIGVARKRARALAKQHFLVLIVDGLHLARSRAHARCCTAF